ncbi:beta-lactamase family protein [Microbacterium sp. zg.Y1090]|uniref:serine hydrolase domain-containing protein n=1 Tax=Microbacterium TaxID=33882 RepID=UPI00214BAFAE|nr:MULTISPECIES: serine hydrolase domain-containing protein [unclassified Microbacterium]MCR2813949.1 beta-lactamase family protein [Microbacterium sp. zg.Y1084]MCR2819223.1 beta-lactamase family protein [Microbacterium sp. zg.Y1090]MDL5487140.1 serine hydrolase domain-containing protein [Microbacterium sp. zg-Y1211]WIM28206.1 serine hydrolase domain-containing protein [Microbacterium sp. zg-Y1090]
MLQFRRARRVATVIAAVVGMALAVSACSSEGPTVLPAVPEQVDAPLPEETRAQLQAAVERAMVATGSTGAIVGVWAPWSGQWVEGLGTSTPGGEAVTTDMRFRVAGITRAMTCDVLDAVAAAGTVSRDDSVTEWITGMPGYEDITLEQLCDSTSGIASYGPRIADRVLTTPQRVWNPKELAAYGMGSDRTGAPGAAFVDSDTGYVLLGIALERATGMTAAEMYRTYVAEPLGLDATGLPAPTRDLAAVEAPFLAGLYSADNAEGAVDCLAPRDLTSLSASSGYTATGVVSDIDDLGLYVQALATSSLPGAGEDRFASPLPVSPDAPSWNTAAGGAYQAGSLIGQYGSVPGYITGAFADPATGMAVAVVLNNSRATAAIGEYLAWELAAIASKAPAAAGQTAPTAGLPWTAEQYAEQIAASAVCAAPEG